MDSEGYTSDAEKTSIASLPKALGEPVARYFAAVPGCSPNLGSPLVLPRQRLFHNGGFVRGQLHFPNHRPMAR